MITNSPLHLVNQVALMRLSFRRDRENEPCVISRESTKKMSRSRAKYFTTSTADGLAENLHRPWL